MFCTLSLSHRGRCGRGVIAMTGRSGVVFCILSLSHRGRRGRGVIAVTGRSGVVFCTLSLCAAEATWAWCHYYDRVV